MHSINYLLVIVSVSVIIAVSQGESVIEKFKPEFEKRIDVEPFLKNNKLVSFHIKCLLGETQCTPDGEKIKAAITEVLPTTCATCSEKQKKIVRQVMKFMYTNRRSDFDRVFDKFDPEKIHREKMMKFMNESR